jgi:aspartate/methionine/tyrosine aminotransferase
MKREVAARGVDIISLGIGDPDTPTFPHIRAALWVATQPVGLYTMRDVLDLG